MSTVRPASAVPPNPLRRRKRRRRALEKFAVPVSVAAAAVSLLSIPAVLVLGRVPVAETATMQTDLLAVANSVETFYLSNGRYPGTSPADLQELRANVSGRNVIRVCYDADRGARLPNGLPDEATPANASQYILIAYNKPTGAWTAYDSINGGLQRVMPQDFNPAVRGCARWFPGTYGWVGPGWGSFKPA